MKKQLNWQNIWKQFDEQYEKATKKHIGWTERMEWDKQQETIEKLVEQDIRNILSNAFQTENQS